jgi:hypothetical protein
MFWLFISATIRQASVHKKELKKGEASPKKQWYKVVKNNNNYFSENGITTLKSVLETSLLYSIVSD